MPVAALGEVRLAYTLAGDPAGPPVLCVAPGGMRSAAAWWDRPPWSPLARLGEHRVIAPDLRNAGSSRAPIREGDGWASYTADLLGLLDQLGVDRFAVVGMCIGGTHAIRLMRAAPERVTRAVLLQPIGLDDNRAAFLELFDGWARDLPADVPRTEAAVRALRRAMWEGDDLLFGASEADVAACAQPILVAVGGDLYHPESVSRRIAELAPRARVLEGWKADVERTDAAIRSFLAA